MFDYDDLEAEPQPKALQLESLPALQCTRKQERIGDLGASVWRRPVGAKPAPYAVVLCPGNPGVMFGAAHAGSTLMVTLAEAFGAAGFPVVLFDYLGVGMSAIGGATEDPNKWQTPWDPIKDVCTASDWAKKEKLGDRIVACGYSFGASQGMSATLSGSADVYISLSTGTRVWMFFQSEEEKTQTKESMKGHSALSCKALYVIGDKDRMTPEKEVQALVKARSDSGNGVSVKMIEKGMHDFKGKESAAADCCVTWLREVCAEEALATAVEAPTAVEEEDKGPAPMEDAEEDITGQAAVSGNISIRCECLQVPGDSKAKTMRCELPLGTTVQQFRELFGWIIPKTALMSMPAAPVPLRDTDPLPTSCVVSEITMAIPGGLLLTKTEAKEAQKKLREILMRPASKQTLDDLEKEVNGNQVKYRMKLKSWLVSTIYPEILKHLEIEDVEGTQGAAVVTMAIQEHSSNDVGILEAWLELEKLMRNKAQIAQAENAVKGWYAWNGGNFPAAAQGA